MKDLNRKTDFDKHWEEVFQDAEMTPPDKIWSGIDSELSKQEAGYFKRRAFMFKLLAAASIAFAMGIGLFSLNYYLDNEPGSQVVEKDTPSLPADVESQADQMTLRSENETLPSSEIEDQANAFSSNINEESIEGPNAISTDTENFAVSSNLDGNNPIRNTTDVTILTPLFGKNSEIEAANASHEEESIFLASIDEINPQGLPNSPDEADLYKIDHIYLIPIMTRGASKKPSTQKSDEGILMASLDFSAGQFNPNFQQGGSIIPPPSGALAADSRSEMASFNATNKNFLLVRSAGQETKPDLTYSYGANLGFKVSSRFIVQTGFAYRKSNTTTTTTGYIENPEVNSRIPIVASYQYQLEGLSSVKRIDETSLSNQYEFASIPVRAGYVVLNKKLNLTLLAGISSEFFINNSISDESDFLETLSSSDAAESPYKNVYFNGTVGTMLGYSFAKNYMVTLEPSYRMAINSFTKDSFYLSSYPSSFMLSFGVAYNFR